MMSNAFLLLFVPAFLASSEATSQGNHPTKWRHIDPLSGSILYCDWCEPGFYMNRVCTEKTATECLPCAWGEYMDHFNREYECRRCSDCRREHEHVKIECSATNNRICQCDDGYYRLFEFCLLHKKCPIGHGVTKKGTPEKDTKCSRCKSGTFSSTVSATEPCRSHTNCSVWEECVVRRGNRRMDNLCGTCVTSGTVANSTLSTNTTKGADNVTATSDNSTAKVNVSVGANVIQPKFSNPGLLALIVLIAIPIGLILYFAVAMTKKDTPLPCRVRTSSDSATGPEGTTLMSRRHQPPTSCPDQQTANDTNTENTQLLLRGAAGVRYRVSATDSVDGRETTSASTQEDLLAKSLTLTHIGHICGEVGDLWRQLARDQLCFSDGICDGFNHDYQFNGQREIVYQMLREYVRRDESNPPTVGDLCDALEKSGREAVRFRREGTKPFFLIHATRYYSLN